MTRSAWPGLRRTVGRDSTLLSGKSGGKIVAINDRGIIQKLFGKLVAGQAPAIVPAHKENGSWELAFDPGEKASIIVVTRRIAGAVRAKFGETERFGEGGDRRVAEDMIGVDKIGV